MQEAKARFPEVCEWAIKSIKRKEDQIQKDFHAGLGLRNRKRPLMKYQKLGQALFDFFITIRDAHGGVSRTLLEEFILTTPAHIQLDLMSLRDHRRDEFFTKCS